MRKIAIGLISLMLGCGQEQPPKTEDSKVSRMMCSEHWQDKYQLREMIEYGDLPDKTSYLAVNLAYKNDIGEVGEPELRGKIKAYCKLAMEKDNSLRYQCRRDALLSALELKVTSGNKLLFEKVLSLYTGEMGGVRTDYERFDLGELYSRARVIEDEP